MSQQTEGALKTFQAGADLEAYRRVKLSSGKVVYAGSGEEFIGVTQDKVLNGENVTVALRSHARTYKMTAAGSISADAVVYGAANGKVQGSASGTSQGTALEAATADGDIIEVILNNGSGAAINGAATTVEAEDGNGSVPIIFAKQGITDATTDVNIVTTAPYKFRIIDWWIVSRDTTAANVKIKNGSNDASAVVAKGTTDDAIVRGGTIVEAQRDVAAAGALKVNASAAAAFDVFVKVIKVA